MNRKGVARTRGEVRPQGRVLLTCFDQMVRLSLRGVWVRGDIPAGPVVWAMNHHHWWDAFASGSVLRTQGQRPTVLVSDKNLASFGLLNWIDAVPAAHSGRALQTLQAGRTLMIMPEGRMAAPGPLGPIRGGAGRIATAAGVPLVPVAVRAVLRGSQHGEVFMDVGPAVGADDLGSVLARQLSDLDQAIASAAPEEPLPGYRLVVPGRRSVDEMITALSTKRR